MNAPVSRCNMEIIHKSHIWLAAAILAACGLCASAGVSRRPDGGDGSITELFNNVEVGRILAARKEYLQRNELGDGSSEALIVSVPDPVPDDSTDLPPGIDFRNILKSSKNALVVTKKEYLKEDWCKTEPLVQTIREPGCLSRTVINNFCYGQCNSFYIPKAPRRRQGKGDRPPPAFKSCPYCRPKKFTTIVVKLRCPSLKHQPVKFKKLQKIKECKCLPNN